MRKAIFIIGNGFDIQSNIESSYIKFLDNCKELEDNKFFKWLLHKREVNRKNEYISWIDFEEEILNVSKMLMRFENEYEPYHAYEKVTKDHYNLFKYIFNQNIEVDLDNYLYGTGNNVSRANKKYIRFEEKYYAEHTLKMDMLVDEVINEIDEVLHAFTAYLIEKEKECVVQSNLLELFNSYDRAFFLNFNFTNTLEKYGIKKEKIYYIHDTLEDPIWGHNDIEYSPFIKYNKKNKQRYRLKNDNYISLLHASNLFTRDKFGNTNMDVDIIVIGHSIDVNDIILYEQLINARFLNIKNLKIYEYNGDAINKILNLYDELGPERIDTLKNNNQISYSQF